MKKIEIDEFFKNASSDIIINSEIYNSVFSPISDEFFFSDIECELDFKMSKLDTFMELFDEDNLRARYEENI